MLVTPSFPPACLLDSLSSCPFAVFAVEGIHTNATPSLGMGCDHLKLSIPFTAWSRGGNVNASVLLVAALGDFHITSSLDNSSGVESEGLVAYSQRLVPEESGLWVYVVLHYIGAHTRGSWSVTVDLPLFEEQFSCLLPRARVEVNLLVKLEAAPQISTNALVVADSLAFIGVAFPTTLVRGGILSSLLSMLRCSEFDPDESLSFINNPTGWSIGDSGPRYQRGSAVTVLVAVAVLCLLVLASGGVLSMKYGAAAAVDQLRLPSCVLPVVLLLSEMGVSSATTLVFYGGIDTTIGLAVLSLMLGYMTLQAVCVLGGEYKLNEVKVTRQSVFQYMLDPTHEVVVTDQNDRWIRRYFYFVDGRSWPMFGLVEVSFGMLSNVLEGIPLTSLSGGLCIARPACVLGMSLVQLGLLVWRVPNAVRLSQWSGLLLTALLSVSSAAVVANIVSPSDLAEGAATQIALGVSVLNSLLGALEFLGLILAVIPSTITALSLHDRTFDAVIARGIPQQVINDVPLLQLPAFAPNAPPSPSAAIPPPVSNKRDDDEAWVEMIIAAVHSHNDVSTASPGTTVTDRRHQVPL